MSTLLNKNFMNLTNFDDLSDGTQIAIYVLVFLLIIFLILLLFVIITNIRRNKRKKEYKEVTQTVNTQKSEDTNQANENFAVGSNADLKAEEEKHREEEAQKEKLIPTAEALGIDDPMQYSLARLEQLIMMAELKGTRDKNKKEEKEEKPVTAKESESKPQAEEKKHEHEHQVFNDKDLGKILDIQLKNQALISNYEKNIKGILKELNNNNNHNNPKEQTPERNERFSEFAKLFIEDRKLKEKVEEKEPNKKMEEENHSKNDKALEKIIRKNEMLEEEIRKMKQENFNNEKKRFQDEIKRKEEQLRHERKLLEEERSRVEQRRFADEIENKIMNKIAFQTAEIRQMANLMKNNSNSNNRNNEYRDNSNNENLLRTIEIELDKLSRKMDYYDKKDYEDDNSLTSGQFERKVSKNLKDQHVSHPRRKMNQTNDEFNYDLHDKNVYENLEFDNNKKNQRSNKSSEKRDNNNKEITQENDKLLETIEIELDLLNKILKENKK